MQADSVIQEALGRPQPLKTREVVRTLEPQRIWWEGQNPPAYLMIALCLGKSRQIPGILPLKRVVLPI